MKAIRDSLRIARKDLKVLFKDRGQLAVLFVLPLLFALIWGAPYLLIKDSAGSSSESRLVIKAYALRIDIQSDQGVIASHPRCYAHQQEICDPLHYLPLLAQRPGAFEHAKPIRHWRKDWPPVYEELLEHLRTVEENGTAVRHFVKVLELHRDYPAAEIEQAVRQALDYGCAHVDGVKLCLHQLRNPSLEIPQLDLSAQPHLRNVAAQAVDLLCYEQLLTR